MGENSAISWTHHTFNPWWGCVKISPACTNCYAATFDHRLNGNHWGPKSDRKFFGEKHWREPLKWNASAAKRGVRERVFCASMADVFEDREDLREHRVRLWKLIEATPQLDWLLLTKRPENIARMLPVIDIGGTSMPRFDNVWLGTTVENQEYANERIPHLLRAPAVVRFLSCEPLLGRVELHRIVAGFGDDVRLPEAHFSALQHHHDDNYYESETKIDWVIAGCESGHGSRPSEVGWYRVLRDDCAQAGTAFFLKQAMESVERCTECGNIIHYRVRSKTTADATCSCTTEGAEDCSPPPIAVGERSHTKQGNVIELPYLDGEQHCAIPAAPSFSCDECDGSGAVGDLQECIERMP